MAFWGAGTKISHPEHLKLSIHMLDGLVYRSLRQDGIMSSVLNKSIVLVLNKSWQAINVRTPAEVFPQLANNVATALDVQGEEMIRPVGWDEWITLPVRDQDQAVHTVRGPIRVPTVIVLARFNKVPMKRPTLSARTIRERDGSRCQYTGRLLKHDEGSLDHVLPRSRGGKDTWENLVWACKQINTRKGNRTPEEAGLQLLRPPKPMPPVPVTLTIKNAPGFKEWDMFLVS